LLSEKLTHIIEVTLITAVRSACFDMTVAYQEVNVLVRIIGMHCEQHFISLKIFISELLCDAKHFIVGELVVIIGREGY